MPPFQKKSPPRDLTYGLERTIERVNARMIDLDCELARLPRTPAMAIFRDHMKTVLTNIIREIIS